MRRHILSSGLCLALVSASWAGRPEKPHPVPGLRIGPDTTVISGPLNELGYPDYIASLNERLGDGVAPDENFWTAYCETLPRNSVGVNFLERLLNCPGFEKACSIPCESYAPAGTNIEAANKQLDASMSRPWKADELPIIARWLEKNQDALTRATEAAARTKAYAPLITTDGSTTLVSVLLPHVQQVRDTARALSARAFLALGEGRGDDAWKDVMTLYRLAGHLERGPFLIGHLVGIAVSSIARIPAEACLVDASASPDVLARRWNELSALLGPETREVTWLESEHFMTLDLTLAIRSGSAETAILLGNVATISPPGSMDDEGLPQIDFRKAHEAFQSMMLKLGDVNETLAFSNQYHARMEAALALPDYLARKAAIEKVAREFHGDATPDHIGSVTAAFFMGGPDAVENLARSSVIRHFAATFAQCNKAEARIITRNRLLHAAFAAELTFRKNGRDVADSKELNAAIEEFSMAADVAPPDMKDPYTGDSFRITSDAERLVVYSVGDNGKSDGGKTFGEGEGCDDLVVVLKRVNASSASKKIP
ncbi:hypothetical protein Pan44_13630 [Caulifigura coniformis]|uniref:Uncharacterized protein n=1 Tax=Caulifigura coniformis TaxID=2527983 RepID=A0A517SB91_9PLAN|nr:hypothetical protein [Caulifigura coniformis]QDT53346.1 hypothetical protein Pan44_13630 [Caulifigura coniformis]